MAWTRRAPITLRRVVAASLAAATVALPLVPSSRAGAVRVRTSVPSVDPVTWVDDHGRQHEVVGFRADAPVGGSGLGHLLVARDQTTGVPGLYAIGDVVSGLNQISVAVGQAAVAALHAHSQLPFVSRR